MVTTLLESAPHLPPDFSLKGIKESVDGGPFRVLITRNAMYHNKAIHRFTPEEGGGGGEEEKKERLRCLKLVLSLSDALAVRGRGSADLWIFISNVRNLRGFVKVRVHFIVIMSTTLTTDKMSKLANP